MTTINELQDPRIAALEQQYALPAFAHPAVDKTINQPYEGASPLVAAAGEAAKVGGLAYLAKWVAENTIPKFFTATSLDPEAQKAAVDFVSRLKKADFDAMTNPEVKTALETAQQLLKKGKGDPKKVVETLKGLQETLKSEIGNHMNKVGENLGEAFANVEQALQYSDIGSVQSTPNVLNTLGEQIDLHLDKEQLLEQLGNAVEAVKSKAPVELNPQMKKILFGAVVATAIVAAVVGGKKAIDARNADAELKQTAAGLQNDAAALATETAMAGQIIGAQQQGLMQQQAALEQVYNAPAYNAELEAQRAAFERAYSPQSTISEAMPEGRMLGGKSNIVSFDRNADKTLSRAQQIELQKAMAEEIGSGGIGA
jgi:hypothetical protein